MRHGALVLTALRVLHVRLEFESHENLFVLVVCDSKSLRFNANTRVNIQSST